MLLLVHTDGNNTEWGEGRNKISDEEIEAD
jgi:hypothetical protein